MALDQARVRDFARSETNAWCSHDPARVAAHYVPGGTIASNGGEPTDAPEVARSFISAAGGCQRAGEPTRISLPHGSNMVNIRIPKFVKLSGVNRASAPAFDFHSAKTASTSSV